MARKKCKDCPPQGAPMWMVTYGDMMSLLLTFFVLIVSFSSIEQTKFKAAIASLQDGLGIWPNSAGLLPHIVAMNEKIRTEQVQDFIKQISNMAKEQDIMKSVEVYNTPKGLLLLLDDKLLFKSGKAEIDPEGQKVLQKIAKIIKSKDFSEIRVEGHTDNVPIHTKQFPSNWDLSAARALAVTKNFVFQGGISPEKISAVGYGEYHPRAPNNTPEGRARNRRVEIYLDFKQPETKGLITP